MSDKKWLRQSRVWREAGLCGQCGRPPEPGKGKCAKHLEVDRRAVAKRRAKLRAEGRCLQCKAPANGKRLCDACRPSYAAYLRSWRKANAPAEATP